MLHVLHYQYTKIGLIAVYDRDPLIISDLGTDYVLLIDYEHIFSSI